MRTTLIIHVAAGAVGLLSGYVALFAAKGAPLHRRVGMAFVYAMLVMSVFGVVITIVENAAPRINVPAGLLTAYLIVTALLTVRPPTPVSRRVEWGAMLVATGIGLVDVYFGLERLTSGRKVGILAIPFFLFGTVALLAAFGDWRMLRGAPLTGAPRLVRHLWRMSFALWIAAMSFFVGQADVLPPALRIGALLPMPGLLVLLTMLYWVWRIRLRRSMRGIVVGAGAAVRASPAPSA